MGGNSIKENPDVSDATPWKIEIDYIRNKGQKRVNLPADIKELAKNVLREISKRTWDETREVVTLDFKLASLSTKDRQTLLSISLTPEVSEVRCLDENDNPFFACRRGAAYPSPHEYIHYGH